MSTLKKLVCEWWSDSVDGPSPFLAMATVLGILSIVLGSFLGMTLSREHELDSIELSLVRLAISSGIGSLLCFIVSMGQWWFYSPVRRRERQHRADFRRSFGVSAPREWDSQTRREKVQGIVNDVLTRAAILLSGFYSAQDKLAHTVRTDDPARVRIDGLVRQEKESPSVYYRLREVAERVGCQTFVDWRTYTRGLVPMFLLALVLSVFVMGCASKPAPAPVAPVPAVTERIATPQELFSLLQKSITRKDYELVGWYSEMLTGKSTVPLEAEWTRQSRRRFDAVDKEFTNLFKMTERDHELNRRKGKVGDDLDAIFEVYVRWWDSAEETGHQLLCLECHQAFGEMVCDHGLTVTQLGVNAQYKYWKVITVRGHYLIQLLRAEKLVSTTIREKAFRELERIYEATSGEDSFRPLLSRAELQVYRLKYGDKK